jgi:hypothetical protein
MQFLHVMGIVGAGKTTIIHQFWPTYQVFDIKAVYTFFQFAPEDLRDKGNYQQFAQGVLRELESYCENCILNQQPFGIVESSGINQALNHAVDLYDVCTIWIEADPQQSDTEAFRRERPYSANLNAEILRQFADGKIGYDLTYSMATQEWRGTVPLGFADHFPFIVVQPKMLQSLLPRRDLAVDYEPYHQGKVYVCPNCHAEFSRVEYLQTHFTRYLVCQPKN